jgi:hypothetical protein
MRYKNDAKYQNNANRLVTFVTLLFDLHQIQAIIVHNKWI